MGNKSSDIVESSNLIKKIKHNLFFLRNDRTSAKPIDVERTEQIFYINYLQEGMVIFDIGAHIGELTLLFSRFIGQKGQVHTFEASRETFERLKNVCESANRKNVILNHKAVPCPNNYSGLQCIAYQPDLNP